MDPPFFSFCTLKKGNFFVQLSSTILFCQARDHHTITSPVSWLKFDINFNSNWPVVGST